jgi:hypothetical protein
MSIEPFRLEFINEGVHHIQCGIKLLQVHSQIVIAIIRAREQIQEAQTFLDGRI